MRREAYPYNIKTSIMLNIILLLSAYTDGESHCNELQVCLQSQRSQVAAVEYDQLWARISLALYSRGYAINRGIPQIRGALIKTRRHHIALNDIHQGNQAYTTGFDSTPASQVNSKQGV